MRSKSSSSAGKRPPSCTLVKPLLPKVPLLPLASSHRLPLRSRSPSARTQPSGWRYCADQPGSRERPRSGLYLGERWPRSRSRSRTACRSRGRPARGPWPWFRLLRCSRGSRAPSRSPSRWPCRRPGISTSARKRANPPSSLCCTISVVMRASGCSCLSHITRHFTSR